MTYNSTYRNDTVLPGNFCKADVECNNGACIDGACVANLQEGKKCVDDLKVPMNNLCPPDTTCLSETGTCEKKLAVGNSCNSTYGYLNCMANSQCAYIGNSSSPVCQAIGMLKNQDVYRCARSGSCNELLCESGYSLLNDTAGARICMPGPLSMNNTEKAIKDNLPCVYKNFTNATDPTQFEYRSYSGLCGFNQNDNTYCNVLMGDGVYPNAINTMINNW